MRDLLNISDNSTIKTGDSSEIFTLSARNDNEPQIWNSNDKLKIHIADEKGNHVRDVEAHPVDGSNNATFSSEEIADLEPGKYQLELWAQLSATGKQGIWPSDHMLSLTIDRNADSVNGQAITTVTLNDFKNEIKKYVQDVIATSGTKDQDGQTVDLTDYMKKSDIVYDADKKTLTIDGQLVQLPANVDLSNYATKDEVPSVVYNSADHTLTVDGTQVDIPASVDLSNYYTKDQVDQKLATVSAGSSVDLTGYVTTADADAKYATKSDLNDYAKADQIPSQVDLTSYAKTSDVNDSISSVVAQIPSMPDLSSYAKTDQIPQISLDTDMRIIRINDQSIVIPSDIDLTGYATKSEIPQVILDTEKRTISVNSNEISIPSDVDLSNFYTKAEVDNKLANVQAGGTVDLSGYLTKVDADSEYAKKADIPEVNGFVTSEQVSETYATKLGVAGRIQNAVNSVVAQIPAQPDLSSYETTSDVNTKIDSVVATIPQQQDLASYAKTADVNASIASVVSTIPASQDLTDYDKTSDVDSKIASVVATIPAPLNTSDFMTSSTADLRYYVKDHPGDPSDTIGGAIMSRVNDALETGEYIQRPALSGEIDNAYSKLSAEVASIYATKHDVRNQLSPLGHMTVNIMNLSNAVKDIQTNYATKEELKNGATSTSTGSAVQDVLGGMVPKDVKSFQFILQFGMIKVTYLDANGKVQNKIAKNGTYNFDDVSSMMTSTSDFMTWGVGYNNAKSITLPVDVEDQKAGAKILTKNIHILSVDIINASSVKIHCFLPTHGGDGDYPLYNNGGVYAELVCTGFDHQQSGSTGVIALNVYDNVTVE